MSLLCNAFLYILNNIKFAYSLRTYVYKKNNTLCMQKHDIICYFCINLKRIFQSIFLFESHYKYIPIIFLTASIIIYIDIIN